MRPPEVRAYFDPETSTVSYVVVDPMTRDAIIIDPVLDYDVVASQTSTASVQRIIDFVAEAALVPRAVLETHAHADHLSGAALLRLKYGIPMGIGAGIREVQRKFAGVFDAPDTVPIDGSQFDILLEGGKEYEWGSLRVRALATPGHTPACLSYLIGDSVFTGDALFMEDYGTGRTDFPAGSAQALYHSVTGVLYGLPASTRVFVGHDYQPGGREVAYQSTIGRERETNVQLNCRTTEEEFVKFRQARDAELMAPRLLYQSIQINVFGGELPEANANGIRYLKVPINLKSPTDAAGNLVEPEKHASSTLHREPAPSGQGKLLFELAPYPGFHSLGAQDFAQLLARHSSLRVIDVREPDEFSGELGHPPGAESVPLGQLAMAHARWRRDEPIVLVCRSGKRSEVAATQLVEQGFTQVAHVVGGVLALRAVEV